MGTRVWARGWGALRLENISGKGPEVGRPRPVPGLGRRSRQGEGGCKIAGREGPTRWR